jgi:hypothetical protein
MRLKSSLFLLLTGDTIDRLPFHIDDHTGKQKATTEDTQRDTDSDNHEDTCDTIE